MFPINVYYKEKSSSALTFDEYQMKYKNNMLTESEFNNLDSDDLEFLWGRGIKDYKKYKVQQEDLLEKSYNTYCLANRNTMMVEIKSVDEFKEFLKECSQKDHILLMTDFAKAEILNKTVFDKSEKEFQKFFHKKK